MNIIESLDLMKKYIKCPKCGCETVGAGTGTIDVDTEAGRFIRTCHCGWKIEIQEDTNDKN